MSSKAFSTEQIDEIRSMVTSVALMLGVDVQGLFLNDASEELYDASIVLSRGSALLSNLADIAAGRGSTEAKVELLKAQAVDFQDALSYVGDIQKDFPYAAQ